MIQIVDAGLSERHIPKELRVPIPSHALIWLGLMPLSPSLLPPGPPRPSSLSSTLSLDEFLGHIDEVHLVK
jgi:hypothetical protein